MHEFNQTLCICALYTNLSFRIESALRIDMCTFLYSSVFSLDRWFQGIGHVDLSLDLSRAAVTWHHDDRKNTLSLQALQASQSAVAGAASLEVAVSSVVAPMAAYLTDR